ncbi:hypothetical protein [Amycolatopsis sp. NPDC051071]
MAHHFDVSAGKACMVGVGTVAAVQIPMFIVAACCVMLMLVAVLALIGTLARNRWRRHAAYRTLKLLLDFLHRPSR